MYIIVTCVATLMEDADRGVEYTLELGYMGTLYFPSIFPINLELF